MGAGGSFARELGAGDRPGEGSADVNLSSDGDAYFVGGGVRFAVVPILTNDGEDESLDSGD